MANNPKRIQDPTEAAMSAIQEALNLREDPPARASGARRSCRKAPPDPFAPPIAPPAPARARGPAPPDPQRAADR